MSFKYNQCGEFYTTRSNLSRHKKMFQKKPTRPKIKVNTAMTNKKSIKNDKEMQNIVFIEKTTEEFEKDKLLVSLFEQVQTLNKK